MRPFLVRDDNSLGPHVATQYLRLLLAEQRVILDACEEVTTRVLQGNRSTRGAIVERAERLFDDMAMFQQLTEVALGMTGRGWWPVFRADERLLATSWRTPSSMPGHSVQCMQTWAISFHGRHGRWPGREDAEQECLTM